MSQHDTLTNLVKAVDSEMAESWECASYHPSLRPALEAARAALSATQPAQAAQSDAASEAFSAMADAVPFHNGWVKPQAAQGEPVARWITHARL